MIFFIFRLQNLEGEIITKGIKLVVIDSVASLVRKEFSNESGGLIKRADFLATEASLLKSIAETFSIPVSVSLL